MKRTATTAIFAMALLVSVLDADEPPVAAAKAQPVIVAHPAVIVQHPEKSGKFWRRQRNGQQNWANRQGPFILNSVRYEPRIRDIRYNPSDFLLPGTSFGTYDTLPVAPERHGNYFLLPVR